MPQTDTRRIGKIAPLPDGCHPCKICANEGSLAYTRIMRRALKDDPSSSILVLAHWCDRGRPLTGSEILFKAGPDHRADVLVQTLVGEDEGHLVSAWNTLMS